MLKMSVKSYVQKTDDSVAIEQLKDFESRYESMIKTVESLPEEKIAEILSDTGRLFCFMLKTIPIIRERRIAIHRQSVHRNEQEGTEIENVEVPEVWGEATLEIGVFKGVSFLGDVSNILYNVVGFPTLILKTFLKLWS